MASKRSLTREMLVKALAMRYDGKTYDQIAEALGCSRTTVARWVPRLEEILNRYYPMIKMDSGEPKDTLSEKIDELLAELREVKELLKKVLNQ